MAAAEPRPFLAAGPPAPEARRLRPGPGAAPSPEALGPGLRPGPLFLRSSRSTCSLSSFSFSTSRISVSHRRASSCNYENTFLLASFLPCICTSEAGR